MKSGGLMMKRFIKVLAGMCFVLLFFVGCGKEKPAQAESGGAGTGNSASLDAVKAEPLSLPITKDGITLTVFASLEDRAAASLTNYGEMLAYQELEKRTGIKLEFIHSPVANATEQFNLMIASGDLTDLIWFSWPTIPGGPDRAIEEGTIIDLREAVAKYAPNFTQIQNEHESVRRDSLTDVGHLYMIPLLKMFKEDRTVGGFQIRKDWLDKLGLQVPTTMDEWYTVLKAFKEKDPNGNGKADEIPMISMKIANVNGVERFTYAWGFPTDFYMDGGKVKYGPVQPGYKEYLKTMAKWYEEGLIDPDFLITDRKAHDAKVTSEEAGSYYGLINSYMGTYSTVMEKINPKFLVVSTPIPMSPDGKRHDFYPDAIREVQNGGFAVSTKNKYVKETIKMLDYYFTEDGKVLMNLGIEGLTFNITNGQYIFTDLITKNPNGLSRDQAIAHYTPSGVNCRLYQDQRYWSQMAVRKNQIEGMKVYAQGSTERAMPMIAIEANDAPRLASIQNEVVTYMREMLAKFIMGQSNIDQQFDSYVKTVESLGLNDAIEIQQRAVERYYKR
jgi:putative aldouronate transport system substrate-binding protein